MEKIFDVMGCDDVFKARPKEEMHGFTLSWANFKELFFLQFFLELKQGAPEARVSSFAKGRLRAVMSLCSVISYSCCDAARNFVVLRGKTGMIIQALERSARGIRMGTSISRLISRIVTGVMTRGMTDMGQTGRAVVGNLLVTTKATIIPESGADATIGTGVSSPTELPTLSNSFDETSLFVYVSKSCLDPSLNLVPSKTGYVRGFILTWDLQEERGLVRLVHADRCRTHQSRLSLRDSGTRLLFYRCFQKNFRESTIRDLNSTLKLIPGQSQSPRPPYRMAPMKKYGMEQNTGVLAGFGIGGKAWGNVSYCWVVTERG
ncbi:hypothetical protein Tco_0091169 [Tanacetum coccineum]